MEFLIKNFDFDIVKVCFRKGSLQAWLSIKLSIKTIYLKFEVTLTLNIN